MIRDVRAVVVVLAFGCAPSSSANEQEPNTGAVATDSSAKPVSDGPRWYLGQTWYVVTHGFGFPSGVGPVGRPTKDRWRCEVVDVDDDGTVTVVARLLSDRGEFVDFDWQTTFDASGALIRFHQVGVTNPALQERGAPPVPFVNTNGMVQTMIPPWWPSFPLVPGQKLSFEDGAITQSTREVDGLLEVELVANPPPGKRGPWRGVTMYWERGRPFWSKIDVVRVPESGIPLTQYQYRGEVVSWDKTNPWAP